MTNLYTVVAHGDTDTVEGIPDDQNVSFTGDLEYANALCRDFNSDAEADGGGRDFRVYQLVDPGSLPLLPTLDELVMQPQRIRLHAAQLAVERFKDVEPLGWGELIDTAKAIGDYIADGTVPALNAGAPPVPTIEIRRGDEVVEVWVDGELVASTTYGQSGHAGMDAVANAAARVALALDYEPEEKPA